MSEELLINISPTESRVALLDNGVLSEIYIERQNKLGSVGNIYIGTVVRVLPGMQAAFVEIGQSRTAFLHVNDMQPVKPPQIATPENATSDNLGQFDFSQSPDNATLNVTSVEENLTETLTNLTEADVRALN